MVLSAPPPDAQPGPGPVASWVERIAKLLRLVERGIIVLVDQANDAQLGPLVRGLCVDHPDLLVLTEAAKIEDAPPGSVIVLATRVEDAGWLNMARPIFAERALRVVLWSKAEITAELARRAPDFFDWIARRFECPAGPPAFAVAGLRAALRARAWAVDWRGKGLDEAFAAALPGRSLIRASAAQPDGSLTEIMRGAGQASIAWSNLVDEQGVRRLRQALARTAWHGFNILDNPRVDMSEGWPAHDCAMELEDAARMLGSARASSFARLAALLNLEPETIALAAEQLLQGATPAEIEEAVLHVKDPGAAMGRLFGRRGGIDPVRVAAYRVPAPMLRAFARDTRVRKAAALLAGNARSALSPLKEVIQRRGVDVQEFERLMNQLLLVDADRNGFVYTPITTASREEGIDGIAPEGMPGMKGGVGFRFQWLFRHHYDATQAQFELDRASSAVSGLKHWIMVTQRELEPHEQVWFVRLKKRRGLTFHHWGEARVEQLLHQCPALLARYYPHEARAYLPGYDGTDFGTLAKRYREKIAIVHNRLKTIGIPPEARPRESRVELPLADLFIPLRLVPEGSGAVPLDLAQVLYQKRSVVVLADPGMGKSTLLAYLALVFVGGARLPGFARPRRLVPLHISLREFVRRQKERPGLSFLEYLEIEARERHSLPEMHRAFFEATLRMGEAVVLLDGLDEVGNETARHMLAASIRTFQAQYPDCRFWVTSRIYGYTDNVRLPKSFAHYRIDRLDDAQIDEFIERWYEHQIAASPHDASEQAESLRAAVRRTPSVHRLAGNPLLLTLMAFIHHGLRKLPKDRGELYEKCVEMLLKTWQEAKRGDGEAARGIEGLTLNVPTQKDYLAHLAFFVQQKNQGGTDEEARGLVSRRDAVNALAARHLTRARRERPTMTEIEARDEMARFLDYVCDETGLVLDRGNDQISFVHLSFQEYLAAWVFLCGTELARGPSFFVEHLGDPAWEEVLLLRLYIVLMGGGGGETEFDQVLGVVLRSLERKSMPEGWLTLVRAIRDDLELTNRDRKEILGRAIGFWLGTPAFEGTWFIVLEDVKLFGTRASGLLHELIAERRAHAQKAFEAIALLHLETKLFGFPEDAAELVRRRADLPEMLADLVPFVDEPAIEALLAEKAKVADWIRALRALVEPQVRRTTAAPTPEAAAAAAALLWEKILLDLRSGGAFAQRGYEEPTLPPVAASLATPLLCPLLAQARQREVGAAAAGIELELHATTLAWPEHGIALDKISGSTGALFVAHAAYASLMTGLPCKLPFAPDLTDPRVRFSHILYELCNFRDAEANVRKLEAEIASAGPELRPLLEAAGLLAPAEYGDKPSPGPTRIEPVAEPKPQPAPALFSWLHLSDIHFGHKDVSHRWNQQLVLDTLLRDIADHKNRDIPTPGAILITGDVAYSGTAEQYGLARSYIESVSSTLNIAPDRIFLVPGNHDIDRTVDRASRNVARLVRDLRDGDDPLDEVLSNPDDNALLNSRLAAYLSFASGFPSIQTPDPLHWSHTLTAAGLPIRLIGLSTPLLSAGDIDRGKLRLGNGALAATLTDADRSRELVLVLTHHPLREGWLADQRDADRWLQSRAHVHLFGHVHEAESEDARSGAGTGLIRIAAGAAHGDLLPPGIPASHGYNMAAVVQAADGTLRLRIWPRRWSDTKKAFTVDVNNVPESRPYAEHTLPNLRLPTLAAVR